MGKESSKDFPTSLKNEKSTGLTRSIFCADLSKDVMFTLTTKCTKARHPSNSAAQLGGAEMVLSSKKEVKDKTFQAIVKLNCDSKSPED